MTNTINRYDLLLVDFGSAIGSEQANVRPAVVVGNEASCTFSPIIIVMPFTSSKTKANIPTHQLVKAEDGGLLADSTLIGEQPTPIDRRRIRKHLGKISNQGNKDKIDKACYDAFFYRKDAQYVN